LRDRNLFDFNNLQTLGNLRPTAALFSIASHTPEKTRAHSPTPIDGTKIAKPTLFPMDNPKERC